IAPTAMIRSSVFTRFGQYNAKFAFEDYPMWLKILSGGGKIFNANKDWVYYRFTGNSYAGKLVWYYQGALEVLEEYLPNKDVSKYISKLDFKFSIKMSLIKGKEFLAAHTNIYNGLAPWK